MPPNGRGNTVVFGKVTVSSEIESMESVVKHLKDIIHSLNYPEQHVEKRDLEAEAKLKEMMEKEDADGSENQ